MNAKPQTALLLWSHPLLCPITPFLNTEGSFLLKRGAEAGSQEQSATHAKRGRYSQNFHLRSSQRESLIRGKSKLETIRTFLQDNLTRSLKLKSTEYFNQNTVPVIALPSQMPQTTLKAPTGQCDKTVTNKQAPVYCILPCLFLWCLMELWPLLQPKVQIDLPSSENHGKSEEQPWWEEQTCVWSCRGFQERWIHVIIIQI